MAFTPFIEDAGAAFPRAELPRLRDLGDRVLLGTDFPNIPYTYADALEALERTGLGPDWLRAVCHDNAARLFEISALEVVEPACSIGCRSSAWSWLVPRSGPNSAVGSGFVRCDQASRSSHKQLRRSIAYR